MNSLWIIFALAALQLKKRGSWEIIHLYYHALLKSTMHQLERAKQEIRLHQEINGTLFTLT